MTKGSWIAGALAALAAGAGGYWAGRDGLKLPEVSELASTVQKQIGLEQSKAASEEPRSAPAGPVVYYRHPDGKPFYSLESKQSEDGRDYRPVHASEDISFEGDPPPVSEQPARPVTPGARRVLFYRNPMGLPDTSTAPKKDSMGMDYIPVYEGEAEASTVAISPGKLQRTGVRSEVVERRALTRPVRAPGALDEDERRVSVVSVRSESFIEAVENVTTGDHVHRGQPLFRLYSPEIAAAAAQYLTAIGMEGARRRLQNLGVPPDVVNEIERTRKVPLTITWTAPRDGAVVQRNVSNGMRAMPGDVLFRIVDHSSVWVMADVSERDLAGVEEGQPATVRVRSFPGRTFTGVVARIYPHLSAETRTVRIRIELANPDGVLRPAMYADVELESGSRAPVVAVPDSAVIDTGARQVVILDRGEGRFAPREVQVGVRGSGFTEIRNGVAEGDRVVVSANFLIDAESNLKAALQGMATSKATP
ncbi:efflux transporter periplasmic adaptor subunit [Alsobacter soli]|uniref:Efflux transporter periplasmic adaptor subunit n=1 Tax=Alsobacter soli TaxID=2109933 RepID=A0A2T1HVH3_9HYPH|nr:efflux RND transporter periplasmic adaptor subunit [Alsobacter soli]PSC05655.1 efflux transporter periplasmic adaptor subunit [Alsobacter soli]